MVKLHKGAELSPNTLTIRGNSFWNWTPEGEPPLVVDPLLERVKNGDRLLFLSVKSPVRAASMGDLSTPDQTEQVSPKHSGSANYFMNLKASITLLAVLANTILRNGRSIRL